MAKIEIRPLPLEKWHGKKGKDDIAQPNTLECLMDNTGRYCTGLTEEETSKYSDILGVSLTPMYKPDEPHPFYSTRQAQVILPANTVILDDANPLDFVKYKFIQQSRFVAKNMKEWQEGNYPEATHVIYSEEEDLDVKASKVQIKRKANLLVNDMSAKQKERIIAVLSDRLKNFRSVKGKDANFLDIEIDKLIEDNAKLFVETVEENKDVLMAKALILEAINEGVLSKEGSGIYFMSDLIGHGLDEAVEYINNPINQGLRIRVMEKVKK